MIKRIDCCLVLAFTIAAASSFVTEGCRDPKSPTADADASDPPTIDAAQVTDGESMCFAMCKNFFAIGCSEAKASPSGDLSKCFESCDVAVDAGSQLDPACGASARNAEEARKCPGILCVVK